MTRTKRKPKPADDLVRDRAEFQAAVAIEFPDMSIERMARVFQLTDDKREYRYVEMQEMYKGWCMRRKFEERAKGTDAVTGGQ